MPRLFALAIVSFIGLSAFPASGVDWYVSPSGSDAASGRVRNPVSGGAEGPFASLGRAREAIRQRRLAGDQEAQTVRVRGGTYFLDEAFKLNASDSGAPGQPVVWEAYEGEKPLLSGAVRLEGWGPWKGQIQRAPLGRASALKGGPRQVILGGVRQTLARYPNADPNEPVSGGWAFADGKGWPMYSDIPGEDKHSLEVLEKDLRVWSKPAAVEIVVFPRYNWWNNLVRLRSVDAAARKIELAGECSYPIRKGDRYFFQNALEELDCPGEWYADPSEGMLYFWPPAGANPSEALVVVSQSLLVLERGTHDIVWRGFTMEGSNGTAISMTETTRCSIESNWIKNVSEWSGAGVSVSRGTSNRVAYNTIEGIGYTGVSLNGGSISTLTEANNVAEHNHIHHFGVYSKRGSGIDLSEVGNKALHNEIHDGPRFGIMHRGNRNEIGWNHIYNVSLETEDTGAIYGGGRDWISPRGTSIYYNYIHDVPGFSMHEGKVVSPNFAWGIYLDDNSGGANVFGNIVARCGRGGLHGHAARDCVVNNNIFVGNKDWQVDFHGWMVGHGTWERTLPSMIQGFESVADKPAWKGMRGMDIHPSKVPLPDGMTMTGNVFVQNLVVSEDAEKPVVDIRRVPFTHNRFDYNLYWSPDGNVRTGFVLGGPDEGADLLAPLNGDEGAMPKGWKWSSKPEGSPSVVLKDANSNGPRMVLSSDSSSNPKDQMIVYGPEIMLEPGTTYRLKARVRASSTAKASVAVQSFVNKVYFWMSPGSVFEAGVEWKDQELLFEVPSAGKPGWHEQMKRFSPRVGWTMGGGTLEVEGMQLHKVSLRKEWEAWRAKGADANSLVADPLWENPKQFTLRPDSPAWKLGFVRIPVEEIGPQPRRK